MGTHTDTNTNTDANIDANGNAQLGANCFRLVQIVFVWAQTGARLGINTDTNINTDANCGAFRLNLR